MLEGEKKDLEAESNMLQDVRETLQGSLIELQDRHEDLRISQEAYNESLHRHFAEELNLVVANIVSLTRIRGDVLAPIVHSAVRIILDRFQPLSTLVENSSHIAVDQDLRDQISKVNGSLKSILSGLDAYTQEVANDLFLDPDLLDEVTALFRAIADPCVPKKPIDVSLGIDNASWRVMARDNSSRVLHAWQGDLVHGAHRFRHFLETHPRTIWRVLGFSAPIPEVPREVSSTEYDTDKVQAMVAPGARLRVGSWAMTQEEIDERARRQAEDDVMDLDGVPGPST